MCCNTSKITCFDGLIAGILFKNKFLYKHKIAEQNLIFTFPEAHTNVSATMKAKTVFQVGLPYILDNEHPQDYV